MTYIGAANRHLSKRIKFYNGNVTKTVFIMGEEITYDEVENPTKYYNGRSYEFSWYGRELTGAKIGEINYSFTYNDEGIRTSKTKDEVKTTYYVSGSDNWDFHPRSNPLIFT